MSRKQSRSRCERFKIESEKLKWSASGISLNCKMVRTNGKCILADYLERILPYFAFNRSFLVTISFKVLLLTTHTLLFDHGSPSRWALAILWPITIVGYNRRCHYTFHGRVAPLVCSVPLSREVLFKGDAPKTGPRRKWDAKVINFYPSTMNLSRNAPSLRSETRPPPPVTEVHCGRQS